MNKFNQTVTGIYCNERDELLVAKRLESGLFEPPTFDTSNVKNEIDSLHDGFWELFDAEPLGCDLVGSLESTDNALVTEHRIFAVRTLALKSVGNGSLPFAPRQSAIGGDFCRPRQLHLNSNSTYTDFDYVHPHSLELHHGGITDLSRSILKLIIDGDIPLRRNS